MRGAVIDSSLLNSIWMAQTHLKHKSEKDIMEPEADLRAQMQQWLVFEKTLHGSNRSKEPEKQRTVFSVWLAQDQDWALRLRPFG